MQDHRRIDEIEIGKRHRRDMGDLKALAASIADVGLLHPVVIKPNGLLIAGERRLRACQMLGWATIPVHVIDLDRIIAGELAENTARKDLTYSEALAISHELGPAIAAEGLKRRGLKGSKTKGATAKTIERLTTKSKTSLTKAEAIFRAAEANPAKYGALMQEVDKTGHVDGPYRRLQVMQAKEQPSSEHQKEQCVERADRWNALRDGFGYLCSMPPASEIISIVRQHDPNARLITVERIEKLRRWLDDLEAALCDELPPEQRRRLAAPAGRLERV